MQFSLHMLQPPGTHVWASSGKTATMVALGIFKWIVLPIAFIVMLVRSGKLELRWLKRAVGIA